MGGWRAAKSLRSPPDHIITVNSSITHQLVLGKEPKWKKHGVDWSACEEEVEAILTNLANKTDIKSRVKM